MADSSISIPVDLIHAILNVTKDERFELSFQSMCQYVTCRFSMNDDDNNNNNNNNNSSPCHVIPISNETIKNKHDTFEILAEYIHLYIYPIFIFTGIFGNFLSCLIMFINVRRNGYPTSLYLTFLALVDCLFLIVSALPDWIAQIDSELDFKRYSDVTCRLVYWFGHFITHLSAGLVVGVTVERFFAVQYPLVAHKLNTVRHTCIALTILLLFFLLLDSPVLILVRHVHESIYTIYTCYNDSTIRYGRDSIRQCVLANEHYDRIWVYIDFAAYTFIPFILIITLNLLIIRRLIDAQRFRQRMYRINNYLLKSDQQEYKYRQYSQCHQAIELVEKSHRYKRRFQSVPSTQSLAMVLRPQSNHAVERRRRFSAKQSTMSTELSTLSSEIKNRSQHHFEISSIRYKSTAKTNSNNTRLTILLLFISCSFLILTSPHVIFNLILSFKSEKLNPNIRRQYSIESNSMTIFFYTLARLSMIINHSINFILYFVLGKRFRRDLKQLFIGYWRKFYQ